jgi:glycosyltransferase involved in cell wall biosynthesis
VFSDLSAKIPFLCRKSKKDVMNLGMMLNAPYPPDLRVKKETEALSHAGFRIHLLCLRKEGQPYSEELGGISIARIDAGKNNFQLAVRDSIMAMTFKHPEFLKAVPDWVIKNKIRAIHVHDLPLAGTALALRQKLGIRVVVDLHENYPEALSTWFQWKKGFVVKLKNRVFMNPDRWTDHERRAVLESDHVIAVVQEMKNRLIKQYGVDPAKVIVVSNTEDKSFVNQPLDASVYRDFQNKFRILYSGGIGPHRGVDTAIEGMKYLKFYPDIELIIIGSGSSDVMRHLHGVIQENKVREHIHFLGYQPFQKFYSFMHFADVNVIPHKSNAHTDNTIPHKLFQAMMAARPLLVSSSDPLKRNVDATNSGLVFQAGDPKDFADKVLLLYNNPRLSKSLGENGRRATVDGNLNWDDEQKTLVDFYRKVFSSSESASQGDH